MIRVHVICEGQTEEMFVNELLAPSVASKQVLLVPSLIGKPGHKGGNVTIDRVLRDVRLRLLSDPTAYCTLLIDYYGISQKFPGYDEASRMNQHTTKFNILIREMSAAIENEVGPQAIRRFIPYIQMHEFESLLFSEANAFASAIGCPSLANVFNSIRSSFRSPEEINDSPDSAPSKRIEEMFPEFQKPIHGTFGAIEIGIEKIRSQCQLFSEWLAKIEKLTVPT